MIRSLKQALILLAALIIATQAQNCTMANCKTCKNVDICDVCSSNYVLSNNICLPCSSALENCNVCNDTVFPLQCISCNNNFYGNSDFSACKRCGDLIKDCSQCDFQAPFERVSCNICINDLNVSSDRYSCVEPFTVKFIIIGAVVLGVVVLGIGGFFVVRWMKKKKLQNPLVEEDEYQQAI